MFLFDLPKGSLISLYGFCSKKVADLLALSAVSKGWRCLLLVPRIPEIGTKGLKGKIGELILLEVLEIGGLFRILEQQKLIQGLDLIVLNSLESYLETEDLTPREASLVSALLRKLRVTANSNELIAIVASEAKSKKLKLMLKWWSKTTIELSDLGVRDHVLAIVHSKGERKMIELKLGRKLKQVGLFSFT